MKDVLHTMRADNQKEKKINPKAFDNTREESDGMRMGYHSEKGITDDEKGDGMRMGYHSEKANRSKHSKRLHEKQE